MSAVKLIGVAVAAALLCGAAPALAQTVRAEPWTTLRTTVPLPQPRETGRQKVGDVELYFATYGRGKPIVLLHPGLGHADYWANQIGPLSQEFEVTVVDLRGHGRTGATGRPVSYELMAQDVVRFIKARHIDNPAVVGWGDGGVVALEMAVRYPKRISKLVLFGAPYRHDGLHSAVDAKPTYVDYVLKTAGDYQRMSPTPAAFDGLVDQLETLWASAPAYADADLRGVKVPTTIILPEFDEWVRMEHVQAMSGLIPDARVIPMADVSHFAPWQDPKRFNDAIRMGLED